MTVTSASPSTSAQLQRASTETGGMAFLEAIRDGRLPQAPIATLLGFDIRSIEQGAVTFALTPGEQHYNPIGMVHGGVAATLLDTVMGCAVHSLLPAGVGYTTLEISVRYQRAITTDTGTIMATGTVLHSGRRTATAEARLVAEASGKLLASATSTLLIVTS